MAVVMMMMMVVEEDGLKESMEREGGKREIGCDRLDIESIWYLVFVNGKGEKGFSCLYSSLIRRKVKSQKAAEQHSERV